MLPANVTRLVQRDFESFLQAQLEELAHQIERAQNRLTYEGLGRSGAVLEELKKLYCELLRDCLNRLLEIFSCTLEAFQISPTVETSDEILLFIENSLSSVANGLNEQLSNAAQNIGLPVQVNLRAEVQRLTIKASVEVDLLLQRLRAQAQQERTETSQDESTRTSSPGEAEIKAEAPQLVRNIKWIMVYGWRHKALLATAIVVTTVGWWISGTHISDLLRRIGTPAPQDPALSETILKHANQLNEEFRGARKHLEESGIADFSRAEQIVGVLRNLNDRSGHPWYFAGEIKRISNTARFTAKSCPRPLPKKEPVTLDPYQQDFYRYIEIARSLPVSETGGDSGIEICYQRPNGYCVQRTAWINHLLANDLFQEAIVSDNPRDRVAKLKRAKEYVKEARKYRQSPDAPEGFKQCNDTLFLHDEIEKGLAALQSLQ